MDLLFLGHRDATITIALLAAFFSATKNTARLKPGGTEPTRNADQAQRRPQFDVRSKAKARLWVSALTLFVFSLVVVTLLFSPAHQETVCFAVLVHERSNNVAFRIDSKGAGALGAGEVDRSEQALPILKAAEHVGRRIQIGANCLAMRVQVPDTSGCGAGEINLGSCAVGEDVAVRLHGHKICEESSDFASRRYAVVHGCRSWVHVQAVLVAHPTVHGSHRVGIVIAADDNAFRANLYGNRVEVAGNGNVLEAIWSQKEAVQVPVVADVVTDDVAVRIDAAGLREQRSRRIDGHVLACSK